MKAQELKEKKDKELCDLLREKRKALREYRFSAAGSRSSDVNSGKKLRREVAQVLTELNSRNKHNQ